MRKIQTYPQKLPKMKPFTLMIMLVLLVRLAVAQDLKVMTYNIRLDVASDGPDRWDLRKHDMALMLHRENPALIGLQEAIVHQLNYLDSCMAHHTAIGVGRDDGRQGGEFSAILYDSTQLNLLQQGTFWLSETPKQVSVGWDAALPRICTWGQFERRSDGKRFWCFNTHFDHMGAVARLRSAELILTKIHELNRIDEPVILMGDLNSTPDSDVVAALGKEMTDAITIAQQPFVGNEGTFNGFDLDHEAANRIDYVFVKGFAVEQLMHLEERTAQGRQVSDHFAVEAVLRFER